MSEADIKMLVYGFLLVFVATALSYYVMRKLVFKQ